MFRRVGELGQNQPGRIDCRPHAFLVKAESFGVVVEVLVPLPVEKPVGGSVGYFEEGVVVRRRSCREAGAPGARRQGRRRSGRGSRTRSRKAHLTGVNSPATGRAQPSQTSAVDPTTLVRFGRRRNRMSQARLGMSTTSHDDLLSDPPFVLSSSGMRTRRSTEVRRPRHGLLLDAVLHTAPWPPTGAERDRGGHGPTRSLRPDRSSCRRRNGDDRGDTATGTAECVARHWFIEAGRCRVTRWRSPTTTGMSKPRLAGASRIDSWRFAAPKPSTPTDGDHSSSAAARS